MRCGPSTSARSIRRSSGSSATASSSPRVTTCPNAGPQKSFRLTADGGTELNTWLRTPPDLSSPPRDELVIKVLVASRVPGVNVHDVIQNHRRHVVELMQEWTRVKRDAGPDELSVALVVDAELFRLDSVTAGSTRLMPGCVVRAPWRLRSPPRRHPT